MRSLTIQVPEDVYRELNKSVVEDMECLCCTKLQDEFLICVLAALGRNEPVLIFDLVNHCKVHWLDKKVR